MCADAADLDEPESGTKGEISLKSTVDCADRVFGILRENNPELTGEKRRTIMKPPQVCPSHPLISQASCHLPAVLSDRSNDVRHVSA